MRPPTPALAMTDGQRDVLEKLASSRTAPHREVLRPKALLFAGQGLANTAIASQLSVSPASVAAWRERFEAEGLAKFGRVREGRGRKPSISEGARIIKTPVRALRANAICERVIGTIRRECLDQMLILGRRHLQAVLPEYVEHDNSHRPTGLSANAPRLHMRWRPQPSTMLTSPGYEEPIGWAASSTNTR